MGKRNNWEDFKVVLDKYDDFFLGKNVTEPVAIEMLVDVEDIHALQRFLENSGFQTTTNGNEKEKIASKQFFYVNKKFN